MAAPIRTIEIEATLRSVASIGEADANGRTRVRLDAVAPLGHILQDVAMGRISIPSTIHATIWTKADLRTIARIHEDGGPMRLSVKCAVMTGPDGVVREMTATRLKFRQAA